MDKSKGEKSKFKTTNPVILTTYGLLFYLTRVPIPFNIIKIKKLNKKLVHP